MRATLRIAGLALGSVFALLACSSSNSGNGDGSSGGGSSSSGGGSSSSGGTPVSTADCTSRCEKKGTECGATAAQAKEGCANSCNGGLTESQLSCLVGKSCDELKTKTVDQLCPGGTSSGGTSSGGQSSSGSSGGNHFSCSLNGTCYKCQDSAGVSKCSIQTGPGPGCTKTDSSYCDQ